MRLTAQVAVADGGSGGGDISYFSQCTGSPRKVKSYISSAISEKLNEISSTNDQIPSLHSEVRGEISALYSNWQTILGYKQINTLSYRLCVTLNQQLNMIKSYCDSIQNDANDIIDDENLKDPQYYKEVIDNYKAANQVWVNTYDGVVGGYYTDPSSTPYDNSPPTVVNQVNFSYSAHPLDYDNRNVRNYTLYISEGGIADLIENIKTKVQSIKEQFDSISSAAGAIGATLTDVNQYTSQIKTIATETNEKLDEIINTFETNANSLYEMDKRVFNLTSEYGEAYDFNSVSENWDSLSEEDKKALLQYSLLQYYISKGTYEDGDSATSGLKLFEVDMDDVKSQVEEWLNGMPDKNNKEEYENWLKNAPFDGVGFSIFTDEGENGPDLLRSIFEGQEDQPQETAVTEGGGGSSGGGGYSGGGYSPSPAPAPEPETETPSDDPGTTDPETPPTDDPGTTDPETPPTEDPGTTDPETPPMDDPGTTDPETPPTEDPGTTDPETPPTEDPGTTDPETPPVEDPGTTEPEPEIGGESGWESVTDPNGDVQEPEVNTGEETFTPPEETVDPTIPEPNPDGTEPLPDPNGDVQQPEVTEPNVTEGTVVDPAPENGDPLTDPNSGVQQPEVPNVGGSDVISPAPDAGTSASGDVTSDVTSTVTDVVTGATDTGVAELNSNVLENDPSTENIMKPMDLTLDNFDPLDENTFDDFDFDDLMEGIDDKIGFSKVEMPKFGGDIPLPTDPTITDK